MTAPSRQARRSPPRIRHQHSSPSCTLRPARCTPLLTRSCASPQRASTTWRSQSRCCSLRATAQHCTALSRASGLAGTRACTMRLVSPLGSSWWRSVTSKHCATEAHTRVAAAGRRRRYAMGAVSVGRVLRQRRRTQRGYCGNSSR